MNDLGSKQVMSKNIQKYMELKGVDRTQMCNDLDLKYSTVSEWLSAKKYPRIDKIELMANYFGIKKSDLIENKEKSAPQISEADAEMFKDLTDEQRKQVRDYMLFLKSKQ